MQQAPQVPLPLMHLEPEHSYKNRIQIACHIAVDEHGRFLLAATTTEQGECNLWEDSAALMLYFMEEGKGGELLLHEADRAMLHIIPHLEQLARTGYDTQVCVNGQEHIIYATIRPRKGRGTWRIRDTHAVLPMPLSELGSIAGMWLPTEPACFDKENPGHQDYALSCARMVLQAYQSYTRMLSRTWQIRPARTSGSTALKSWRRSLNPNAAIYRQRKEVENLSRSAYFGGLSWDNGDTLVHNDMQKLDVNAMYASVMRDCGVPTGLAGGTCEYWHERPGVYICSVTCPKSNPFPFVPERTDTGTRYPKRGTFETVIPSNTIELARSKGYEIEVIYGYIWDRLDPLITDWVNQGETLEVQSAQNGIKKVVKLARNSLSGKFGQRVLNKQWTITANPTIDMTPAIGFVDGYASEYLWYEETTWEQPHIQPHWAMWITAAARNVLVEAVYAIGPEKCIYGDTDSIVASRADIEACALEIGTGYGQWKIAGDYKTFQALHSKTYLAQDHTGQWEIKANGVPHSDLTPSQVAKLVSTKQLEQHFQSYPKAITTVGGGAIVPKTIARTIGVVYNQDRWARDTINAPP